jgi:hypothetical protein
MAARSLLGPRLVLVVRGVEPRAPEDHRAAGADLAVQERLPALRAVTERPRLSAGRTRRSEGSRGRHSRRSACGHSSGFQGRFPSSLWHPVLVAVCALVAVCVSDTGLCTQTADWLMVLVQQGILTQNPSWPRSQQLRHEDTDQPGRHERGRTCAYWLLDGQGWRSRDRPCQGRANGRGRTGGLQQLGSAGPEFLHAPAVLPARVLPARGTG